MKTIAEPRVKIYSALKEIRERYHFAPLDEGPNGKLMPKNLVLMTLSYLLDKNHLLIGEPGWGKTTGAKIIAAALSGVPYDLFDAMEIRGNPQKYEEKIVARFHYGKLSTGIEEVKWQGTFALPVLVVDEGNRLPYDSQDVILQGIDTGRWNYWNASFFEGKKPTFITMNERPGDHHQNGFVNALKDRFDIITEEKYWTTMRIFEYVKAKRTVAKELCDPVYTNAAIEKLSRNFDDYRKAISGRLVSGRLKPEERIAIQEEILEMDMDNDAMLFLQAFMAEIDFSRQFGCKRSSDPPSTDTHDKNYAGVAVRNSFSPRSAMAMEYASALAWFLGETQTRLDHMRFVLPYLYAHKAEFSDDYRNKHGNDVRTDCEMIHLGKTVVDEVHTRYAQCIQPMKNFIARLQSHEISAEELENKQLNMGDGQVMSLKEVDHDHPLMKDLVREFWNGEKKAFYEE